ncbi:MFS transporter [Arthrobacter sp. U41]|uniref:MFS transporter n=1 Tax=Arthrobacter sp. U41 TaxID=1849032 RepID=UPI0012FB3AB5|nr:MFS transporter [Arthrobacter sp. U41]
MRGQWRWPALAMFAAGYGANQFVPLLALYRRTLALTDADATAVFGVYALGLIPGLIFGGRISDRRGRRPVLLAFTALSLLATAVLMTGQWGTAGLYAGRLLTGLVSGTVFTAGTAWVKELSGDERAGAGARRAALALTAGFGIGPLVAGPLAQWGPAPQVLPYIVHLALAGSALLMLPRARETVSGARKSDPPGPLLPPSASSARFRLVVVPLGPWVFGSVTLVFTTLPGHGTGPTGVLGVAFPGLLAAGALAAGVVSQRLGRRLYEAGAARGSTTAAVTGLGIVAAGCAAAAFATAFPGIATAATAALILGAGYGICLIVGLREVEEIAAPEQLGALIALFYSLAYSGLAVPFLLALIAPTIGYPQALLFTAAATTLTMAAVFLSGQKSYRARPERNNT